MDILLNISRSKGDQTMKFGQLIKHPKRNIFLKKYYAENEAGKVLPVRFLFFKKDLYWLKASGLQLDSTILG